LLWLNEPILKVSTTKMSLVASTNIRCGKNLKGKMDDFLEETDRYDTQTDFVNTAIRNQLEREKFKDERIDEEQENVIRRIVKEELEQYS